MSKKQETIGFRLRKIPVRVHKQLKVAAALKERSMESIIIESVEEWLKKVKVRRAS